MENIVLEINGRKVRLKDFPMRALKGVILGFINSLKLEEEPKEILIRISLEKEEVTVSENSNFTDERSSSP